MDIRVQGHQSGHVSTHTKVCYSEHNIPLGHTVTCPPVCFISGEFAPVSFITNFSVSVVVQVLLSRVRHTSALAELPCCVKLVRPVCTCVYVYENTQEQRQRRQKSVSLRALICSQATSKHKCNDFGFLKPQSCITFALFEGERHIARRLIAIADSGLVSAEILASGPRTVMNCLGLHGSRI